MSVIAHLRGHAHFPGHLGHFARFPHVVRQRFLAVHVLALLHRRDRDDGVIMIRRGAEHRVDRFFLFQHLAKIFVLAALVVLVLLAAIVLLTLGDDRLAAAFALVIKRLEIGLFG